MMVRQHLARMALVFLIFFSIGAGGAAFQTKTSIFQQITPEPGPTDTDRAILQAFEQAAQQNRSQILGFLVFDVFVDRIVYAQDGSAALLWLGLREPDTGEIVASEPGLSIAFNTNTALPESSASWSIVLPTGDPFIQQLSALPPDLLTDDIRSRFLTLAPQAEMAVAQVFTGYKLPWTAGAAKRVTNSIGHVYAVSGGLTSCPQTCLYAFDFADGTMFPLLAAKGGIVKAARWTCPNFGEDCTNYLVLEDQSTIPTSYQLYYHLAYNSIPDRLRVVGTPVIQGEYIGDVDDTGFSTGHHLHFHVYLTATGTNWSWGPSVDITFDDVAVNGGRPRTCAEASQYPNLGSGCQPSNLYVSGNTPANPPVASMDLPSDRQVVTTPVVRISGSAADDIQITRIQVVANYDGTWKTIDDITPAGNGPYAKDVNLCAAGVPDGPFGLAVRVYDREGSLAQGLPVRQMIKNAACGGTTQPPPAPLCTPGANQVALYSETDFRGDCQRFEVSPSGYTAGVLGGVGDNNAASIQVGSGVRAVLFDVSSDVTATKVNGRVETFEASDASLSDNRIGADRASGLLVESRAALPDEPFFNAFGNQAGTMVTPTSLDSLVLAWEGGAGATAFDVSLVGGGKTVTQTITGNTSWSVGSLTAGSYTFSVKSRNSAGSNTSTMTFAVGQASWPSSNKAALPYYERLEGGPSGWTPTGLWRHQQVTIGGRETTWAWGASDGADYNDVYRAGDLTSPPLDLPAGSAYSLSFWYYADVEDGGPYWDQRRVQISKNGGPFTDLFQLSDDPQQDQVWLNSGPISLAAYAGSTIRVRFHFDTVDEVNNSGLGWLVDEIRVNTDALDASCADDNNTPAKAQQIAIGSSTSAVICPQRDIDYYKFTGQAGQPILVDINATGLSPASALDPYLSLIDSDGRSVIAENDDEIDKVIQDPLLIYILQRSGTYYLKLKAWDYPGAGSRNHFYQLNLMQSIAIPPSSVRVLFPNNSKLVPMLPFNIQAEAVDDDGGSVSRMEFFWHGPDWSKPEWAKLGVDTNGRDGWSFTVNPGLYGNVAGSALYVQAVGKTGGTLGTVMWDLAPDPTTPVSQMLPLPERVNSTAVELRWTASDPQSDISRFELEYQVNSGSGWSGWQRWTARSLPGMYGNVWFVGTPGYSYNFRLRALDKAGNVESFPDFAEATTTLSATCVPDPNEPRGQTLETSVSIPRSGQSALLNLCKSGTSGAGDVDWLAFDARRSDRLLLITSRSGGAAFSVKIYNQGRQLLGSFQSSSTGSSIAVPWSPPQDGTYYLEVTALPGLFGTDARYQVWYGRGTRIFLPSFHRR